MSDEGIPQAPASAPAPSPQPVAQSWQPAYSASAPASAEPPKRSRAWLWITLGVLATVAIIFGSCALSLVAISGGSKTSGGFGDKIAVIHIDGVIAGTGSNSGGVITPEEFRKQLRQAEEDSDVKALVLRVDSPGGTVAASEEIASYVKHADLPVVVSIGDVGASGAYMVSSQADSIFALPGSAVGSIGVISEIPNVSGLLNKIGVDFQVITAGELKDTGSPYRSLTTTEKALIKGQVDQAYQQFIDIVAAGRSKQLKKADVEKLATGWAWNGDEAKKLGLVDKIGTYQDALDEAAHLGKIEGDYSVVTYDTETLQDVLGGLFSASSRLDKLGALTGDPAAAARTSLPR